MIKSQMVDRGEELKRSRRMGGRVGGDVLGRV